jgi:hypothetical protein
MSTVTMIATCLVAAALAGLALPEPRSWLGIDLYLLLGVLGTGILLVQMESASAHPNSASADQDGPA